MFASQHLQPWMCSGGEASDYGVRFPIDGTNDQELYQTERFADTGQELMYTLPMPLEIEGVFVLTLKFSEVYFSDYGKKVFSIAINDVVVTKDLDIFKAVGKNKAHDEQFEFRIDMTSKVSVGGAQADYDGQIQVRMIPSPGRDNPKVNALLITKGSLADYRKGSQPKKKRKKKEKEGGYELALSAFCSFLEPTHQLCG
jgi:hypothetical protein